jgi:hypothetical protein
MTHSGYGNSHVLRLTELRFEIGILKYLLAMGVLR